MTSMFAGGTSYTQSAEVLGYLKIVNPQTTDSNLLDNTLIPMVCNEIDVLAGTSWGSVNVTDSLSIGRYALYGMYVVGAPVVLEVLSDYPVPPGPANASVFQSVERKRLSGVGGSDDGITVRAVPGGPDGCDCICLGLVLVHGA